MHLRASHLHADYGHTKVCATQVHSQGTLGLQNMVNILGDAVLDCGEAEGLLQRLVQVDGLQELEDTGNCIPIAIDLGADKRFKRTERVTLLHLIMHTLVSKVIEGHCVRTRGIVSQTVVQARGVFCSACLRL